MATKAEPNPEAIAAALPSRGENLALITNGGGPAVVVSPAAVGITSL